MFTFQLDENYLVTTAPEKLNKDAIFELLKLFPPEKGIYFGLLYKDKMIGFCRLITDFVDVAHFMNFVIDPTHRDNKLKSGMSIGEAFLKIIFKYPPLTRKPEFHFVFSSLEQKLFAHRFKFSNNEYQNIMIRNKNFPLNPNHCKRPKEGFLIVKQLEKAHKNALLNLLKDHTYWAANYTDWKLDRLIENSESYSLFFEEKLIGFSRILTDFSDIASIWDVVIHSDFRKKGLAQLLMNYIFSDPLTQKVSYWVLYTDNAHGLYKKFGFTPANEITDSQLLYKLRLQAFLPAYSESINQRFFPASGNLFFSIPDTETFLHTKKGVNNYK